MLGRRARRSDDESLLTTRGRGEAACASGAQVESDWNNGWPGWHGKR